MNSLYWMVSATVGVILVAVVVWGLIGVTAPSQLSIFHPLIPAEQASTTTSSSQTTTLKIALLDTAQITNGKERGCDRVVLSERTIAATSSVLTAAMRELFAEEREQVSGAFNFIARTNHTLHFERAVVENGVAKIYLTGALSGLAGVCDDPRAQIQIEETALQFDTVDRVEMYLNGTKTNLTPSQR